jgi:hypothetical protein
MQPGNKQTDTVDGKATSLIESMLNWQVAQTWKFHLRSPKNQMYQQRACSRTYPWYSAPFQ